MPPSPMISLSSPSREQVPAFLAKPENAGRTDLALVELPPYASPGEDPASDQTGFFRGRISDARQWFVETPTLVELEMGKVKSVSAGEADPHEAELRAGAGRSDLPVIEVKQGRVDLGYVATKSHRIVRVRLEKPVVMRGVRSECRCMSALAQGDRDLALLFVAPSAAIAYDQRLLILTNDGRVIPLRVTAAVGQPITWEPAQPATGPLAIGDSASLEIALWNHSGEAVRLLMASSSDRACRVALPREPVPAGGKVMLTLDVECQVAGSRTSMLTITTSLGEAGTARIPVDVVGR